MERLLYQSGVIPYRLRDDGLIEVLLVTSSTGGRWQFPKGMLEPGLSPAASAEQEAQEEAGALGIAAPEPVAHYRYRKAGIEDCSVALYPMQVQRLLPYEDWPEGAFRQRRWATLAEAEALISRPALRAALGAFAHWLGAPA